jgi:hypothetical protein
MEVTVIEAALIAGVGAIVVGLFRFIQRSVRRELEAVVKETIQPELERINHRIDAHMDREELELARLIKVLAKLSGENPDDLDSEIRS